MEAMEALEDGFLALDESLRVLAANQASEQLLGLTRAELSGQALSTVLGAQGASAALLEGCQRALAERVATRITEHRATADQWLEVRIRPQRGQLWLFLRDVTREHQTEQRLKDFEQQQAVLRYVIANVPHRVFWKDRKGRFLGANQNYLNDAGQASLESLVGKTDYDLWKKEEADFFVQVDRQVMESGAPMLDIEEPIRRADGSERTLLTSKVPLRDEKGHIIGMLGIYADITERKRIEVDLQKAKDAAEAAVRAKSEFLTVMSHELRTPLTLILGPLGVLLSDPSVGLPERARVDLERIHRNAERLFRLVDDILDHQKVEAGRMEVDWEPAEIASLTAQLVEDARSAGTARGVDVRFEADPDLGVVPLDRRKFEKIVLNLLGNALKFTPQGGLITAALRARDSQVELSVTDTGPGIPESKQGLLFQRFQQLDGSTTRQHEGTGMGLAIVKEFTGLMGGEVAVESRLGAGSRFIVRLPRSADRLVASGSDTARSTRSRAGYFTPVPLATLPSPQAPQGQAGKLPRLLIAEDNPDMSAYLASLLAPEYELEQVGNGRQAWEAVERQRPDVIVSDVMMPEMDGTELVARLKASPAYRDIPILLLTAKASREERVGGLEGGADDYLGKPFTPAELLARVRAAVRTHTLYQELQARKRELESTLHRLRATQDQLLQKGKMAAVGSLVAGLCHELNNPMAAIRMNIELLARRRLGPEQQRTTLEAIDRQSRRCAGLVKALLEFSSRPAVVHAPCDVAAVVGRVIEIAGAPLARRSMRIDSRPSGSELPRLHIHGAEMETALLHVVKNAVEASPEGSTVMIDMRALEREGRQGVEVAVIDHGHGIPQDMLPHVIEPFFTTKPPGEGTGLGLAMTYRFLEAHGGSLNIESEPGRGTTVRMWLPAAPVLETAASVGGETHLQ
jgi:PAS domain S-box-containing protein